MDSLEDFNLHNLFKYSISEFKNRDPHLLRIAKLPFDYFSSLALEPNFKEPGIYLITGGRQVGKTTFLKQYILHLLEKQAVSAASILFLAGELINSHHILIRLIESFSKPNRLQYLFIDEVNYIPDWDKGIKYLADAGLLENTIVFLTGSDSLILRTAMQRFAGRRGKMDKVDYLFYPLSFKEFVLLKHPDFHELCELIHASPLTEQNTLLTGSHQKLSSALNDYLIHGGYLPAIANFWQEQTIHPGTVRTYIEWIIGDMLKFKKTEKQVFEILKGILTTYSSQISWHSLLKHLSIEHHQTASDYCQLLQAIHVIYILEALDEKSMMAAPKKNKKLYFQDPFVYHAASAYVNQDLTFEHIKNTIKDPRCLAELIEGVVIAHCKRQHPTFYIKGARGEVDAAMVDKNRFLPIEVKWTSQLRALDLQHIKNYSNGFILWNCDKVQLFNHTPVVPLTQFLLKDCSKF